jgi:ice-binding like protein
MRDTGNRASRRRVGYARLAAGPVAAVGAIAMFIASQPAVAATAPVGLGTAGSFAVLAGQTVTNTGPSLIHGNLGVSPGTAVTGFPPGIVTGGTIHRADGVAGNAQSDLTTAYNDAAGRSPTANVPAFIGAGQTLAPGVYKASSSLEVGGALTLNAGGDPSAVWIFQAPSTLTTDTASSVILTNGAQACHVFWQVGSSATLGTNSTFVGSILALTSITVQTGDTIQGRALARNGSVTLDDDTITAPHCTTTPPPTPTPTATSPTPTPTATSPTPTPTATGPRPTPTATGPRPTPTATGPRPTPTATGPRPTPTATKPAPASSSPAPRPPRPAPAPTPVGTTFPVTG